MLLMCSKHDTTMPAACRLGGHTRTVVLCKVSVAHKPPPSSVYTPRSVPGCGCCSRPIQVGKASSAPDLTVALVTWATLSVGLTLIYNSQDNIFQIHLLFSTCIRLKPS